MNNLEKLIRLIISKNEPTLTMKVLTNITTSTSGVVFIHCVYVIKNVTAFTLMVHSEDIKQSISDEWGETLKRKIEKSVGEKIKYFGNTIISEKQYKEKKNLLTNMGYY